MAARTRLKIPAGKVGWKGRLELGWKFGWAGAISAGNSAGLEVIPAEAGLEAQPCPSLAKSRFRASKQDKRAHKKIHIITILRFS
jgi:hypothetical protein